MTSIEEPTSLDRYERDKQDFDQWWHRNADPYLRRAFPHEYEVWLKRHVACGGHVSHTYDYPMPDDFYVATSDVEIDRPLMGARSVHIVCPSDIKVSFPNGYGHCSVYEMKDYQVKGDRWTPTYRDINVRGE